MSYKIKVHKDDCFNRFIATVILDGEHKPVCGGSGTTEAEARENAKREYKKIMQRSDTLASNLREQEKVMAGLTEKAKREGVDGRLIAMANTDFERGFMALEKAINTNKG